MSVMPVLMPLPSANAVRAVESVRAGGNATSNGTFHGESAADGRVAQRRVADRRASPLSRNGTSDFASTWHGPLLKPAFVAQVLGQVLMDRRSPASVSAYRGPAQIGNGLLLNRRV